jgi:hypothetical protein
MAIKPKYDKVNKVFDYIFENVILSDSRFFPEMWPRVAAQNRSVTVRSSQTSCNINRKRNTAEPPRVYKPHVCIRP